MPAAVQQIIQSDAEWAQLPEIEAQIAKWTSKIQSARARSAEGTLGGWTVIANCYAYGKRGDVQATLNTMKFKPDGTRRRGRELTGHRMAMLAISEKLGVTLRTLENWQRSWIHAAQKLQLELFDEAGLTKVSKDQASLPEWVESLTATEPSADSEEESGARDPLAIARSVAKAFQKAFLDKEGRVIVRGKERKEVLDQVNAVIGPLGFELIPHGKQ